MPLFKAYWQRWLSRRIPPTPNLQLSHRCIFIMPSRYGLVFCAGLLLMLMLAINYSNNLAYALTFLLASMFFVAILHTYRNLSGLCLTSLGASPVFVGEQSLFRVRLDSPGRARQAIGLGWAGQPLLFADVPLEGAEQLELQMPATQRGWLRPGRLRVESHFPLGLLVAWSWVDLQQAALVYPAPLPCERPLGPGALEDPQDEQGRHSAGRGVDDFQGLRAYQPGDSRRRMHWKAYSRGQGLLVKDFSALAGRDLWLDFAAFSGDIESRLSQLCHWVLRLSEEQQAFGLRLPGEDLQALSGDAHREACLRALALFGGKA